MMKKIDKILEETKSIKRPKNLSTEFQHYGVFIAEQLDDTKHYSLYIKLCKQYPRSLIDQALNYTKGYTAAKSKGRVFMWKLTQLRKEKEALS
jgi:hypothetical protein